jgi:hypothetical protein
MEPTGCGLSLGLRTKERKAATPELSFKEIRKSPA